jgi:hypothetical protein
MVGVQSEWEARMPSSLTQVAERFLGGAAGTAVSSAAWAFNYNVIQQGMSFQAWLSSTPVEFNLTILFDAENDAFEEVVRPMTQLSALVLPYRSAPDEALLQAPGPSPIYPNRARISVRLGRFVYLNSVILVAVNNTFDTRMNALGQPISGQCDVTIRTINTPARDDVQSFFTANSGENRTYGTRKSGAFEGIAF